MPDHAAAIDRIDAALDRLHDIIGSLRPPGRVVVGAISVPQIRYFAMKEQFEKIERLLERFEKGEERRASGTRRVSLKAKEPLKRARVNVRALLAAHDLRQQVNEIALSTAAERGPGEEDLLDIVRELALLDAMARSTRSRVVLLMRLLGGAFSGATPLYQFYARLGWKTQDLTPALLALKQKSPLLSRTMALVLEHAAAEELGGSERGVHLVIGPTQQLHPVLVMPLPLGPDDDPLETVLAAVTREEAWQESLAQGTTGIEQDPTPSGEILRIFDRHILDLRSGLMGNAGEISKEAQLAGQAMVLAGLPLAAEVEEA